MLIELAIGDSFGAGYEFARHYAAPSLSNGYIAHPTHELITGGTGIYTDDTQMSIAVAETMLYWREPGPSETRLLPCKEWFADAFVDCFKRDERKGYAGRFYNFLCSVKDGKEFLKNIRPDSDKNGAAMRSVPIGLYSSIEDVKKVCELQARITHDTPGGVTSSQAVGLMSHYFYHGIGERKNLRTWLVSQVDGPWLMPWSGKVRVHGVDTARAVVHLLATYDRLSDIIIEAVNFGGDTDSVAAIASGIASLSAEFHQDIPGHLYSNLENGPYGRDFLIRLDDKLFITYARNNAT